MKIVLVTGGFDPIHSGHISYLKSAKALGDKLVVGLNSDAWLDKKKEKFFMPFTERKIIIENLSCVDQVISFEDDENGSAIGALEHVKKIYPEDTILFANGGDRNIENIPEMSVQGVKFLFGVGGDDKKKLIKRIIALIRKYRHYGQRRIKAPFMFEGWEVGRKLVQQVRRLEGLGVKGKKPRRRRGGTSTALPTKAGSVNEVCLLLRAMYQNYEL